MAESRKRRARKRLTVELNRADEIMVRELRVEALRRGLTLRDAVLEAVVAWTARRQQERGSDD